MSEHKFFLFARDETQYWQLPKGATKAWGIYIVKEGEASFCAAIQPSSYAVCTRNEFEGDIQWEHEEQQFEYENMHGVGEGEYFRYIDYATTVFKKSDLKTVEAETSEEAWAEAIEYFAGNHWEVA